MTTSMRKYRGKYNKQIIKVGEEMFVFDCGGFIPNVFNPEIKEQLKEKTVQDVCTIRELVASATDIKTDGTEGTITTPYGDVSFSINRNTMIDNWFRCEPIGQAITYRRTNALYQVVWTGFDTKNPTSEMDATSLSIYA